MIEGECSRMTAAMDFFSLKSIEEKKEYSKLTPQDREELAEMLKAQGYKIRAE